jgi:preprotein translocase subunit SecE
MATKATIASGDDRPDKRLIGGVTGQWNEFTTFLSDVRAEMRKVVTPSRKEVQSTTTVVIIAVFIFGLFFFVVDAIFSSGMNWLLKEMEKHADLTLMDLLNLFKFGFVLGGVIIAIWLVVRWSKSVRHTH